MNDTSGSTTDSPGSVPVAKKSSFVHNLLFGKPRDINDPSLFHSISLIPFLAWVGLGVDGLSSCAYGPDESFRALFNLPHHMGDHPELAVLLALATTFTVAIISWSYTGLIEHFPYSGGGYGVASKLLGPFFGLVSGCALLVDYVLTVTTSIASGTDQLFNVVPAQWAEWKMPVELLVVSLLIVLNLRGIKESIRIIVPVFIVFVATHLIMMGTILLLHPHALAAHAATIHAEVHSDERSLGMWVLFVIFLQAYSRGAGTYTGIEAVSNGVSAMREPQVTNAKWTMLYMAVSLAITAGGLMLCYLVADLQPDPLHIKTMNGLLVDRLGFGSWFTWLTLGSEAGLLLFAAQTGYIGGPRVMANMALDGWVPRRFSSLSDSLTSHYGVLLVGAAAIASLIYTKGSVDTLVTMYAINVFVTFSLSQIGMTRFCWARRKRREQRPWRILVHATSFLLCFGILIAVVILKFTQGAWVTLFVTGVLIFICILIHRHYQRVRAKLAELNAQLGDMQTLAGEKPEHVPEMDPKKQTAVLLVNSYSGLGIHTLLILMKTFPGQYKQVYFATVGVLDSGNFKGTEEVSRLRSDRQKTIDQYVLLAHTLGLSADGEFTLGTDPVAESTALCTRIRARFPRSVFFAGKLLFELEKWYYPLLHNETAYAITRRLQLQGIPMVVMPIRILKFQG